jgi:hypothetical protein
MNTPQQLADKIEKSIPNIEKALQGYEVLVISDIEGAIKSRIFNKGESQKGKIGKYKNGKYKQKREDAGRQTDYVDLQFTGELNRSIQKGIKGDKQVVGFNNDGAAEIAEHLEEKYNKVIFAPSSDELKDAIKTGETYMVQQLTKIVQSWL